MRTQQGFAEVNGTRLYYESAGEGLSVVLIHGFSLDTRMWDDQFEPLAGKFQVIRYDMRGFGRSALPDGAPFSPVSDLEALLDRLGIVQASLVGLSKGGMVALDFSLAHPQRVRSLALLDTVLGGFDWSREGSARNDLVWQLAGSVGLQAARESWLAHPYFEPALRQPQVAKRLAQFVAEYSGWHFLNDDHEQGLEPPAARRLAELRMPLLVLIGELDVQDFRQIADLIHRQVPHSRLEVIPDAGHMSNMEAPAQVNALLLDFLWGMGTA